MNYKIQVIEGHAPPFYPNFASQTPAFRVKWRYITREGRGSGDMSIGAGIGGDIAIDLETGITSYSASISFGIGTPGEAHELFTTTNTITTEDLAEKIYQKMTPQGIRSEEGQQNSLMEENQ